MIKISKNLKKFRKLSNLTQEQLAERMNLTRQAISNWENDKSQPDIQSIEKLSEVFGISVEEMIYGDTKKVGVDENTENKINVMKIVLSVFGGLFVAAGVITVFVAFWQDFPDFLKSLFSFLPFVIGAAFAAYVYFKKRESNVWCEVAGIVWCIGAVSSVGMAGDSFEWFYSAHYDIPILIECLLCIPAMFLLKSVSVLPVFYYFQFIWGVNADWTPVTHVYENFSVWLILPLLAIGLVFTHFLKSRDSEPRYKFAVWVSVIAFAVTAITMYSGTHTNMIIVQAAMLVFLSYCFISEKQGVYSLPFTVIGSLGVCGAVIASVITGSWEAHFEIRSVSEAFILVTALVYIVLSIVFTREDIKITLSNILLWAASALAVIIRIVYIALYTYLWNASDLSDDDDYWEKYEQVYSAVSKYEDYLALAGIILCVIVGVSFILKGIGKLKLFELNIGIITVFAAFVMLVSEMLDFNLFTIGILLILFGASMFASNLLVSKQKKELKTSIEEETQ